jgi:hypothetical protein
MVHQGASIKARSGNCGRMRIARFDPQTFDRSLHNRPSIGSLSSASTADTH